MDAFREVRSENASTFLNLNAYDGRDEVFVLLFTKKLLLAQIVDTDNVPNASDQLSGALVKGIRDVFTWSAMQEFKGPATIGKLVCFDEAKSTASRSLSSIETNATIQVGFSLFSTRLISLAHWPLTHINREAGLSVCEVKHALSLH